MIAGSIGSAPSARPGQGQIFSWPPASITHKLSYITQYLSLETQKLSDPQNVLEAIFGNATAEKVFLYIETYGEGYAQAIADTFDDVTPRMAQVQLARFERGGVLLSQLKGRTRLFSWNPRYPFQPELRALLRKALESLPEAERKKFFVQRRRPRRIGKPL